jgi:non-homologous end joining protein Ku
MKGQMIQMIEEIVLETTQAMNALQLSMAYSNAVHEMMLEAHEAAAQMISQVKAPPATYPMGQFIDTYA